ncbi:hypothetical protein DV737_g5696, partial [Chaetothyriales sp. CBS 132003]
MNATQKSVLVTGCTPGGLGFALAKAFRDQGFLVLATVRNLQKAGALAGEKNLVVLELDVTSAQSVASCVQKVRHTLGGGLDILVNNAGTAIFGPLIHASVEEGKAAYDVNVWGPLAVSQAFAPLLIESKGIIVNISSIAGAVPLAWQETLKMELSPLGVRVITAMVGAIGTHLYANHEVSLPEGSYYTPIEAQIKKQSQGEMQEPFNEDVDITARNIVKDTLAGRRGQIWRGGEAGRASILSCLDAESAREPIAIIGLTCKFGGDARNPEELWKMMAEGRSAWSQIPTSRFNVQGFLHPDPEKLDTMHVRGGHFLREDIALFDAPFFNFSTELAASLDPQFRLLLESVYESLEAGDLLSADGKSFAFDSRANGYGRGEGIATVVLKRLKDATAAGDPVRAVIRETLVNQDGWTKSITSPSQTAQEALMRDCYRRAQLNPLDTQYLEAHGTGTKVGDPIEAGAVVAVFQPGRPASQPLCIGSIKTNIGHTEATSGLAGVIKIVLSMEKHIIPPSVNFNKPNPNVPFESASFKVVADAEPWPLGRNGIRRASLNSFGYGGTNAHIIIDSAESYVPSPEAPPPSGKYKTKLLVLSGRSERACENSVMLLKNYLETKKDVANEESLLENVIYTLGQRRTLFPWVAVHRVTFSRGIDEVSQALTSSKFKPVRTSQRPRIGMVFTGQGAQWHAMGRELLTAYPPFKASLEEGGKYLKEFGANWELLEEFLRDADATRVNDTAMSIPICVALQISLVRLLCAWGVTPSAVASHSSGEIAAAYAVGALSYRSAIAVAYYRAELAANYTTRGGAVEGAMLAIGAGLEKTEVYLDRLQSGKAVAGCINSPSSVTVAGDIAAVQEIEDMAKADGVFTRRLRVETAYHSHHMDPIAEPYRQALINHNIQSAAEGDSLDSIAFVSAVTGGRISKVDELVDPEHWIQSLTQPVRFVEALSDMVLGDFDPSGTSVDAIIEVGPHTALGGPIKEIIGLPEFNGIQIPYYSCLVRKTNARDSIQDLIANLMRQGHPINLEPVNFPWGVWPHVQIVKDLPSYPWEHSVRYWHESRMSKAIRERAQPPNELLGSPAPWENPRTPSWRHIFRINDAPWVKDHIVDSIILYPASGYICRAIEAMAELFKTQRTALASKVVRGFHLRDIDIQQALMVPDSSSGVEIQTSLCSVSDKAIGSQGWVQFVISSVTKADAQWTQHATGMISIQYEDWSETLRPGTAGVKNDTTAYHTRPLDSDDFYSSMRSLGIKYGPTFKNITTVLQSLKSQQSEATFLVADTLIPNSLPPNYVLHPTTLDSVIQAAYTTLSETQLRQGGAKVPRSISSLWVSTGISREPGHQFNASSFRSYWNPRSVKVDVSVTNALNRNVNLVGPVLKMEGLVLMSTGAGNVDFEPQVSKPWEKEICNMLEWAPDMSLVTPENLRSLKQALVIPPGSREGEVILDLRRICVYFIHDALISLTESDLGKLDNHHLKYYAWLQVQLQLAKDGKLGPDSGQWVQDDKSERRWRMNRAAQASVNGEMVCHLGPHLAALLRRDATPLELMMEGKLLYKYYSKMLKSERSFQHAANLLQRLVHKNPRARILEIGGGTGGQTRYALRALGTAKTGGPMAALYHFTDISAAFFEVAAMEFSDWREIMQFNKFDVEKDPGSQGFECGTYDIIIACQVLHATRSMARTMSNVRKLLKPGGSLLMVETTNDQMDVQFVFGLLPGWGLLWITHGGAVESEQPNRGLAVGFMRALRNEYVGRKFLTLDLDPKTPVWSEKNVSVILRILTAAFASTDNMAPFDTPTDFEYAERGGCILVPRIRKDLDGNRTIFPGPIDYTANDNMSIEPFHQANYPLSLQVGVLGSLETIGFNQDHRQNIQNGCVVSDMMVQIEPYAYGANFCDGLVTVDQVDERVIGMECAGIVTKVGALAASHGHAIGDRVFALLQGPFASRVCTEWTNVVKIPANLTFEEAATVPVIYCTALISLNVLGRLKGGQSILIHAASGGIGQGAIMIAQHLGATVYATDALIEQMTIDDYQNAIRPKVDGTWNLHSQFSHVDDLDFFVILSSNVGTLGNASQANYAAGGTYQDALARWRVARGLPCVSIDLPAVKSVGYVAGTPGVRSRMTKLGLLSLDEDVVLKLIESAILAPFKAQIVAGINVSPGKHWNQDGSSQLGRDARFWPLQYHRPQQENGGRLGGLKSAGESLPSQLSGASSRSEANRLVNEAIAQKLSDVFTTSIDEIDMDKSPGAHGVDSLVAVELRNMLRQQVAAEISSFEIMQSPSLAELASLAALKNNNILGAMNALILHGPGDLKLEEVNKPVASAGSVVVRVIAAPIWDYVNEVIDGSLPFPHAYPLVFGTCCVGRIEEIGPDVAALYPGQLVFCDHIIYLRDAPEKRIVLGYHGGHSKEELHFSSTHYKDGCFAEYARFPTENVHIVNEESLGQRGISFAQLGEISGVMSAIGAFNAINLRAGETVLVMPETGFFSSSAIVAALGLGANVVVTSGSKGTLDALIKHFGEDGTRVTPLVLTGDVNIDSEALRAATPDGKGADAFIDFSSPEIANGTHLEAGIRALKRFGRLNSIALVGAFAQSRRDVEFTIRLIEAGNIKLRKDVAGKFGLQDIDKALKLAKEASAWGNMVVIMP